MTALPAKAKRVRRGWAMRVGAKIPRGQPAHPSAQGRTLTLEEGGVLTHLSVPLPLAAPPSS